MNTYLECWASVAAGLFSQALAGEPQLVESSPRPLGGGAFGFAALLSGEEEGRFSVLLEETILEAPLLGDGVDQKGAWSELLREIAGAAAGKLLAQTGRRCKVERFAEIAGDVDASRAFELRSGERAWALLVRDELRTAQPKDASAASAAASGARPGFELLLDVELEASLRFGSREMPLGEILDLGPGDVVQLDRHVSDPVDLLVGDKIVARGEVVLINGNFGLRVTEVAEPQKRLETIRCLF
jgi:flagellar motor switch protein FliN